MKKRILALLLVATMACGIVACGSKPTSQDSNKETVQNSETESADQKKELTVDDITETDLLGEWVVTEDGTMHKAGEVDFVLEEDGICQVTGAKCKWEYKDGIMTIDFIGISEYEAKIADGKIQLLSVKSGSIHVKKQDWKQFSKDNKTEKKTIEITLDNWQDYFKIIDSPQVQKDAFDEIELFHIEKRFAVKSEYADKLVDCDVALSVYKNKSNYTAYTAKYDIPTKELLIEINEKGFISPTSELEAYECKLLKNDAINGVWVSGSGVLDSSVNISDDKTTIEEECCMYSEIEVTKIQGTLVIKE